MPAFGRMKPATMAKVVVLPAPFGPISAVMAPAGTSKIDAFDGLEAAEADGQAAAPQARRHLAMPPGRKAMMRRSATPYSMGANPGSGTKVRGVGDEVERDRAEDRARHRAGAPDHGDEQHLDAALGPEGDDRVDVEVGLRVEHAAGAVMAPEIAIAATLVRSASTPSARAASSFSRTAIRRAPKRLRVIETRDGDRDRDEARARARRRRAVRELEVPSAGERDEHADAGAGDRRSSRGCGSTSAKASVTSAK